MKSTTRMNWVIPRMTTFDWFSEPKLRHRIGQWQQEIAGSERRDFSPFLAAHRFGQVAPAGCAGYLKCMMRRHLAPHHELKIQEQGPSSKRRHSPRVPADSAAFACPPAHGQEAASWISFFAAVPISPKAERLQDRFHRRPGRPGGPGAHGAFIVAALASAQAEFPRVLAGKNRVWRTHDIG